MHPAKTQRMSQGCQPKRPPIETPRAAAHADRSPSTAKFLSNAVVREPSGRNSQCCPYSCIALLSIETVRVDLAGHGRVFVSKYRCDRDGIQAGVDQSRSCGVVEIVEGPRKPQLARLRSSFAST